MTRSKQAADAGLATTLSQTYDKVSDQVVTAYAAARDRAAGVAQTTASGMEANLAAAVLGGLALGIVAAGLLPRSDREQALLAPLGGRVADAARAAFEAAKTAGTSALDEGGLSPDRLRGQVSDLFGQALGAAGAAGTAAVAAAREAATR